LGFPNRFHNNCQQDFLAPSPEHHQSGLFPNIPMIKIFAYKENNVISPFHVQKEEEVKSFET
jgi:hypothetical protein